MDHEILREMEKALEKNKILEKLKLSALPSGRSRKFCHHLILGIGRNASLSEVDLNFAPINWDCPNDGRMVYVSCMLCDSVGYSV